MRGLSVTVIAIDPGPIESAVVWWSGGSVVNAIYQPNDFVLERLSDQRKEQYGDRDPLAIEMIGSYGMAVGAEVFDTCVWIGRFAQAYGPSRTTLIKRGEVKMHLCHSMRANDSNVRQALIDRLGKPGTKRSRGVTYGISGDLWSALALAVTFYDGLTARVETSIEKAGLLR